MHVCGTKSYWELWNDKSATYDSNNACKEGFHRKRSEVTYRALCIHSAHHTYTHRIVCCSIDHILVNL